MVGCLHILPTLAAGMILVAGLAAPLSLAQSLPDVAIVKYVDPRETDPFAPGNEITYQIYLANESIYPAADVFVRDILPERVTYVSSSQPGFILIQAGPDQVIWVRDRLTDFEAAWLSVTVRANDDAPVGAGVEDRARVTTEDPGGTLMNDSVCELPWQFVLSPCAACGIIPPCKNRRLRMGPARLH